MARKQANFRFSDDTFAVLKRLSKRLGMDKTAVIEEALRRMDADARRESAVGDKETK